MRIKYVQPEVCPQSYKSILGQRPIWDWRHDKLLWVDIYENKIIESDQNNSQEKHYIVSEGVTNILLQDNEEYNSDNSLRRLQSVVQKLHQNMFQ